MCVRLGLKDYGLTLNIREVDEIFNYFGKSIYVLITYVYMLRTYYNTLMFILYMCV